MDCFYAAIEVRDNPKLAGHPVAVGGQHTERGVLCTCNYVARKFGVRSAMPTATALRLCPELLVLPVNMAKYKQVSRNIHSIFQEFTELVEPLALDEAYLDVSNVEHYQGSATLIAEAIRAKIWQKEKLTASAGVATNKFLAKIASGWNKPDGIKVIRPQEISEFIRELAVDKLFGVGKVTAKRFAEMGIKTCNDLQKLSLSELNHRFGKLGLTLYNQARGIDNRGVEPNRPRKSLSVEETFSKNLDSFAILQPLISEFYLKLLARLNEAKIARPIKSIFAKVKFADFRQTTAEISSVSPGIDSFKELLAICYERYKRPIRLVGIGVIFDISEDTITQQQSLF